MGQKKPRPEKPKVANSDRRSELSVKKQRFFRFLAIFVVPTLVLLTLELVLRLTGYGYPTHFFIRSANRTPQEFAENAQFGWRFFPRHLARAPDPIRISKTKPPGTYRIFVLGESAALGDPEPAYSFSRLLKELLQERCPGTQFEVVNVAMTAINSHAILPIARDCVPFKGDVWVLYMGNNEVVGPFGPSSAFGSQSPPLSVIRASVAAKRMRLAQMLDTLLQRVPGRDQEFRKWEGMKMMLKYQIHPADNKLKRVYDNFAKNLTEILNTAKHAGVRPIVCTVSANLKDSPPFASLNQSGLSEARKREWEHLFAAGTEMQAKTNYAQALRTYLQACEIDDTYAELRFRLARCHMELGNVGAARKQYALARDLDALRFRVDTRINSIIRDICASRTGNGVRLFDAESVVNKATTLSIPGHEYFWDHVHFNFAGNYLIARELAEEVIAALPERVHCSAAANRRVLTEAECAERLAFTDWDQRWVLQQMLRRVREAPFTGQLNHEELITSWSNHFLALEHKLDREELAREVAIYSRAIARRHGDWILHHRFAFLLEASSDFSSAEQHWKKVIEIIPGYVDALFKLGDVCAHQSRLAEARQYYHQVLQLRPESFEAMNGLGLVMMSEGKTDEAAGLFRRALQIDPRFAQAHVNLGVLLASLGMTADAEAHYLEAIRCEPESAGAHINLGNLLAARQKHQEAIEHYQKALRLQPHEATVELGLANSLEALGRSSEAMTHYQEAVRLNPALAEAHFNLGVALAKKGDLGAATVSFQEAVRLNPSDPQVRLSLGVALAQQNRLQEAIPEFQAVLRLDPANQAAKRYLSTAMERVRREP